MREYNNSADFDQVFCILFIGKRETNSSLLGELKKIMGKVLWHVVTVEYVRLYEDGCLR